MARGIRVDESIDCTVVNVDAHYTGTFEALVEYVDDAVWKDLFAAGAAVTRSPQAI